MKWKITVILFNNDVVARLDWAEIAAELDQDGYAILSGLLHGARVLPEPLGALPAALYEPLSTIANRWNQSLGLKERFPDGSNAFQEQSRKAGLPGPRSYMSRLRERDYQALQQRNDGAWRFPLQLVALLSEPGVDFTGGEFVMTEQRPRMQSRPMVLPLQRGDAAIIAVARRPIMGRKGYYRVNNKHAISRVHSGERIGLELYFD
ncbi:prolyl 4-hydroxylase [Pollutimonas nitritireducens]|uniref:Prolyl 4-hydroxylase n=1 Tax=Pollutimonas nitritireducens TaxID=2045209 RepID=A0A2N4UI65_9BURK|nr:prolyl 4-hydroxylase [Pollutimonas nitritireducens]